MTDAAPSPTRRGGARRPLLVLAAAVVAVPLVVAGYVIASGGGGEEQTLAARQEQVARAGAQVMPFDLDRTTHAFIDLPDGGTQTVTADDPADADQIALIQQHLQREADAFAAGDFADPAAIHSADMPGLAELADGADRIQVRYEPLPDGARITYRTREAALVTELHSWFQAQNSDHGSHADHSG